MNTTDNLSPLKRAILEIRDLRAQLEQARLTPAEPIAIIGMGLRIPGGAQDTDSFWRLLRDGVDAISQVPRDRWDMDAFYDPNLGAPGKMTTRFGGFLERVDLFDPAFFGISPREALSMDPQQRLLLEVTWEALENAGQAPDKLAGSDTGIFAGISNNDYFRIVFSDPARLDTFSSTGNSPSVAVGRLSYWLGLHGPNMAIDTACSSSLVAVHLAVQNLRAGKCRLALAGGVNVILLPEFNIQFSKAQMMAADGRCKTFDARADGYVRSEGAGMIVLKRLADAQKEGDKILAVIRGTAINHDGKSSGLTAPNGVAQEAVLREALADARIDPREVSYVEAHGTGTSLGDPIEVRALGAVYGPDRQTPLTVGSIKTNVGHLEAAAGIAGLAKVVLMLQRAEIPPNLHFATPNPHIAWDQFPISIPTQLAPWTNEKKIAGVSSFGFSGTNAHVILAQAPLTTTAQAQSVERPAQVLTLSAKTENALRELATRYAEHFAAPADPSLADLAYTANAGRSHFAHRLAIVANSKAQAREKLDAFLHRDSAQTHSGAFGLFDGHVTVGEQLEVVFLFTGFGSHYVNMGRQLFETQPLFRKIIAECDELLRAQINRSLISILYPASGENELDDMTYGQPAMFALQYALASLWRAWGIEPTAVAGHSIGEYAAACVAGVFSLEDALKLVTVRGRLMQALPDHGEMVTVFADEARVAPFVARYADQVSFAAINSLETLVISGHQRAVEQVVADLHAQKIKTRKLPIARAAHSPMVEPILAAFARTDADVKFSPPHSAMVSTVTGKNIGAEIAAPDYWRRHLRQTVRFANAMQTLYAEGYRTFLEIGPNPTLISLGQRCVTDPGSVRWLPSLRESWSDWQVMLESLAALYVGGAAVDWAAFDRDYARRKVALPLYPFERKAYWWDRKPSTSPAHQTTWESIVQATRDQASQAPLDLALQTYAAKWEILDRLTDAYINNTFVALGAFVKPGERHTVESLLTQCGIVPAYRNLMIRWMNKLARRGSVQQDADAFIGDHPLQSMPLDSLLNQARAALTDIPFVLDYVQDCGNQLVGIVTGKINALETLFPNGAMTRAEMLYQDWSMARYYNHIVRVAVQAATRGKKARIIEIGAGTGATTAAVLPALDAQVEYGFTDVSDLFLLHAQEKFRAYPFVRYGVLNLEQDARAQGYAPHSFDVVIAANVLHVLPHLRETLQNILTLLSANGILVLLEATTHLPWLDITTLLMENRQSIADDTHAETSPLLTPTQWQAALQTAGFEAIAAFPPAGSAAEILAQHVILARAPANRVADPANAASNIAPVVETPVATAPVTDQPSPRMLTQLRDALPDERHELLVQFVRAEVMRILRMDERDAFDRRQRLMDLGVDSLMAVELRSRLTLELGLVTPLPATLTFDYPTVEAIAEYLERDILAFEQPAPRAEPSPSAIDDLREDEIEKLLMQKLKSLS